MYVCVCKDICFYWVERERAIYIYINILYPLIFSHVGACCERILFSPLHFFCGSIIFAPFPSFSLTHHLLYPVLTDSWARAWWMQAVLRMVQMQWDDAEEILQEVLNNPPGEAGCDSNCPEALLLQAQLLLRFLSRARNCDSRSVLGILFLGRCFDTSADPHITFVGKWMQCLSSQGQMQHDLALEYLQKCLRQPFTLFFGRSAFRCSLWVCLTLGRDHPTVICICKNSMPQAFEKVKGALWFWKAS